jgi:hypothetical protein
MRLILKEAFAFLAYLSPVLYGRAILCSAFVTAVLVSCSTDAVLDSAFVTAVLYGGVTGLE